MKRLAAQEPVQLLDDDRSVGAVLSPLRRRILEELAQPDSASGLAMRLGLPRQKVNYHLRELERGGLVELAEERQRRGFFERVFRPSARAFIVDPSLLGSLAPDRVRLRDRFSSAYLVAAAAALIRDVSVLRRRAERSGKRLLTQTVDTEVSFRSPEEFEAFTSELVEAIGRLVRKHGARDRQGARRFRFLLAAHPVRAKAQRNEKGTRS